MSKTDPYAVTQVKRTTGYAENQGSWPWVNRQHAYNISSVKWIYQIYNKYVNWDKMLLFRFTTGWARGALYAALFMVMQKLGRSYKLKILILILIDLILCRSPTLNLSNLILRQLFQLYSILIVFTYLHVSYL